jgi:hypothetical protein
MHVFANKTLKLNHAWYTIWSLKTYFTGKNCMVFSNGKA